MSTGARIQGGGVAWQRVLVVELRMVKGEQAEAAPVLLATALGLMV